MVKVGGKEYPTIMDKGVQRFIADPIIQKLYRAQLLDLNRLSCEYQKNKLLTKREYAEFNMKLGYSVCGFADLSFFQSYKIENPLWK